MRWSRWWTARHALLPVLAHLLLTARAQTASTPDPPFVVPHDGADAPTRMPVQMRAANDLDTILYTLDGAHPAEHGRRYTGTFELGVGEWRVRAVTESATGSEFSAVTERTYVVYAEVFGWAHGVGAAERCVLGVGTHANDTAPHAWIARGMTTSVGGRFKFRSPSAGWIHLPADDGADSGADSASRCVDASTMLPLPLPAMAPPGWRTVSPLSTAAASLVLHRGRNGDDPSVTAAELASTLALPFATPALEHLDVAGLSHGNTAEARACRAALAAAVQLTTTALLAAAFALGRRGNVNVNGADSGADWDALTRATRGTRDARVDAAVARELAPGDKPIVGAGAAAMRAAAGCARILRAAAGEGSPAGEGEASLREAAAALAWLNALVTSSSLGVDERPDAAIARMAEVARLAHGGASVRAFVKMGAGDVIGGFKALQDEVTTAKLVGEYPFAPPSPPAPTRSPGESRGVSPAGAEGGGGGDIRGDGGGERKGVSDFPVAAAVALALAGAGIAAWCIFRRRERGELLWRAMGVIGEGVGRRGGGVVGGLPFMDLQKSMELADMDSEHSQPAFAPPGSSAGTTTTLELQGEEEGDGVPLRGSLRAAAHQSNRISAAIASAVRGGGGMRGGIGGAKNT